MKIDLYFAFLSINNYENSYFNITNKPHNNFSICIVMTTTLNPSPKGVKSTAAYRPY